MGIYLDKGNEGFCSAINSQYIDKTKLIAIINKTLGTERRYTCVTRCRRFGKTMAIDMLRAYYDRSCDSQDLFEGLSISQPDKKNEDKQFEKHLNKYPVITLDITKFTTRYRHDDSIVKQIEEDVKRDILMAYPNAKSRDNDDLMEVLLQAAIQTGDRFIMLIDEWDAILREMDNKPQIVNDYVDLLRRMFKGDDSKGVFAGVYMTGILPIKKYNTQSALNNFKEYSIIKPGQLDTCFGFTPAEVEMIADRSEISVEELKDWYDGYMIGKEKSIYNPYSVMKAAYRGYCDTFWESTSAYDAIVGYIKRNFEGLKDDIICMLAGGRCSVNTTKFQNDLSIITCKDDVLTVLIHLGYLTYDREKRQCYIPNKEVRIEMTNAVEATDWTRLNKALATSEKLLRDTIDMNEDAVAKGIELTHDEETSILSYNDENSLACVLSIAYYYAKNDYIIHREYPTGKGFADLVLIPRKNTDSAAIILELKYNKDSDTAIDQIKRKKYPMKIAEYTGDILLVGISYDKDGPEGKKHSCKIERFRTETFTL